MRWVTVLLAASLALVGCDSAPNHAQTRPTTPSSPSASPTQTPTPVVAPPPPPAPKSHACYRLSYGEAVAPTNDDRAVPCAKVHTSQTFAVGRLDVVKNGHLLGVDSKAVQKQVAQRCPAKLATYVGATQDELRLSLLRPVWFTPTVQESDAGAEWYRCDVIAVNGDKQVATVDHGLSGALKSAEGRTQYGICGTAQPGTAAFRRVLCRTDHSWRAISVINLADVAGKHGSWPGVETVRSAGQSACQSAARAIASDSLDYKWGYEWPTKEQWQAGQDYGRCWSPDPA